MVSAALVEGRFIRRASRFSALVALDDRTAYVHVPNSGRLEELLVPKARVVIRPAPPTSGRKTEGDLLFVRLGRELVSVDAGRPPGILAAAIRAGQVPEFRGWTLAQREPGYGAGRFDLELVRDGPGGQRCFIETKSVTLVEAARALFPDAPTVRGVRHLQELQRARREGYRCAVAFLIQRSDARWFTPYTEADREFARELRVARDNGVEVYAYTCRVDLEGIELAERIDVVLSNSQQDVLSR